VPGAGLDRRRFGLGDKLFAQTLWVLARERSSSGFVAKLIEYLEKHGFDG